MSQDRAEDTGLSCLAVLARLHEVAAEPDALRHRHGLTDAAGVDDLLRAARGLGLRAVRRRPSPARLSSIPLPAIAEQRDGRFALLIRAAGPKVLLQDAGDAPPRALDIAAFEEIWSGLLILVQRGLLDASAECRFGLGWFLPPILRYRRILGEVLAASVGLQVFALASPVFFQVVIDKVLVQRGLSTLDILVAGLVLLSLFETLLAMVRTYTFAHTANRIDVELGARLYDHLLGLPMSYFGTRRVGDQVARVRELENIRSFLTGASLTLVIDLVFTVVFLGVMLLYNVWLTSLVVLTLPLRAQLTLQAGMQVTADIKTGRRSLMSYLLSPLARRVGEGMRER